MAPHKMTKEEIKEYEMRYELAKQRYGEDKVCPICGKHYRGFGNNGLPVIDSRDVCDECNKTYVFGARMGLPINIEFAKRHARA